MANEPQHVAYANQAVARRKYAGLRRAVQRAGFFAPHVQILKGWDRVTCTSRHVRRFGYTGFIIWVTKAAGSWYFSTPHPHCYRITNPRRAYKVITTYLSMDKRGKSAERDAGILLENELLPMSYDDFREAVGATGVATPRAADPTCLPP
jgi:hypothetical protein